MPSGPSAPVAGVSSWCVATRKPMVAGGLWFNDEKLPSGWILTELGTNTESDSATQMRSFGWETKLSIISPGLEAWNSWCRSGTGAWERLSVATGRSPSPTLTRNSDCVSGTGYRGKSEMQWIMDPEGSLACGFPPRIKISMEAPTAHVRSVRVGGLTTAGTQTWTEWVGRSGRRGHVRLSIARWRFVISKETKTETETKTLICWPRGVTQQEFG